MTDLMVFAGIAALTPIYVILYQIEHRLSKIEYSLDIQKQEVLTSVCVD